MTYSVEIVIAGAWVRVHALCTAWSAPLIQSDLEYRHGETARVVCDEPAPIIPHGPLVTPWGAPTSIEWLRDASGAETSVAFITTASHGGYYVARDMLTRVPLAWREITFKHNGLRGWFEEDCDWSLVALAFPELFIAEERAIARRIAEQMHEPKLYRGAFEGY